jgi:transcriptional regulator with XRE-family HTH domain
MSLSLGQSESYINKIENGRTMPSIQGLLYICEYFSITPQEFFNTNAAAPQKSKELMGEIEKLTASQADHVIQIIRDITGKET